MKRIRTKEWNSIKKITWLLDKAETLTDELKNSLNKFSNTKQSYVLNCYLYDEILKDWTYGNRS